MKRNVLFCLIIFGYLSSCLPVKHKINEPIKKHNRLIAKVITDKILLYDSLANDLHVPVFAEKFGRIDYPILCHITEKNDTLLVYKLNKRTEIEHIFITDVKKGKVYFVSSDSKLIQSNIRNTPIYPYFMDFFAIFDENAKLRNSKNKFWMLAEKEKKLSVVLDKTNLINRMLERVYPVPTLYRTVLFFGGTNDGDFDSYLTPLVEESMTAYMKQMMGKDATFTLQDTTTDTLNLKFMEVNSVSEIPVKFDSVMSKIKSRIIVDTIR